MQNRAVLWFTGLSNAGKTTLTKTLSRQLQHLGCRVVRLDSDTMPLSLIKPQAPSWHERQRLKNEHLLQLAQLFYERESVVLIASVGRFRKYRDLMRQRIPNYLEIYLQCPLGVRIARDVGEKYSRHGDYFHYYEQPLQPDLTIETDKTTPDDSAQYILRELLSREYINPS